VNRPEDDLLHRGSDDPSWNESAWFGFTVPEHTLTGWVYFYHRPNMHHSVGGVALWDPTGMNTWDCRYYDWGNPVELPADAEMYDFTLDNGLSVHTVKPQESFALDFHGEGCDVTLTWDAVAPAQAAGHPGGGLPTGSDGWGKGHYSQAGRMRGDVQLAGERLAVNCFYARDHSWGPRRYRGIPRGEFGSVVASADSGFCILAASDQPVASDPCVGVDDPVLFGWYLRDGEPSRLVSARRTVTARGADGRPLRVVVHGTDELGRDLHAVGSCQNTLHWHGYGFMYMFWCYTEWEFDGLVAVGEEQDYFPLHQARRLLRGLPAAASARRPELGGP
jgi:hypothetical protein